MPGLLAKKKPCCMTLALSKNVYPTAFDNLKPSAIPTKVTRTQQQRVPSLKGRNDKAITLVAY
jgi:hypothetical protein